MSGEYPYAAKLVSPLKCNEKPWDLWVSEIGHLSPRRDDEGPPASDGKARPHKAERRLRRAGFNRLRRDTMGLHGLFPQMDNINAAVCHMCGAVVKCSAAYRHLQESHSGPEPLLPPPTSVPTHKSRSRHKKDPPPPLPVDLLPVKMETSPVHTATAPLSRVVMPQPETQYLDEANSSAAVTGDMQVCVETGELPVVSIQDTEDLPLGENITDDIFEIMNSEGIQSADDLTNAADWKNIIRDIGNMQDINFPQPTDPIPAQELYPSLHAPPLAAYTMSDAELAGLQFGSHSSPMLPPVLEPLPPAPVPVPAPPKPTPPKTPSRSKTAKTKFNLREYDPNKHCGVVTTENPKPCTRSLTCKAHALSLRRMVEGRAKAFDTLLAEHRASRDAAAQQAAPAPAPPPPTVPPPTTSPLLPPLLVNSALDLGTFNGLTAEQQVNDIYAHLLSVEEAHSVLPDTSSITSLLSQPPAEPAPPEDEPRAEGADVWWYAASPRPLALCSFNASHAGGAVTLGKRFATVRSNIKSSLSRSQCKVPPANSYYYSPGALSLSKSVHMNASKTNKPEIRKLIVTCSAGSAGVGGGGVGGGGKEVHAALSELFGHEARPALNGHALGDRKRAPRPAKRPALLDLGFSLDPLLADEKC